LGLKYLTPFEKQKLIEQGVDLDFQINKIKEIIHLYNLTFKDPMFKDIFNISADDFDLDLLEPEDKDSGKNIESEVNEDKSSKNNQKKLTIEYFGTDLTKEAKEGLLDPVI
jgi:ATP-dependent Clp protease ATP-binding subunit ClpA